MARTVRTGIEVELTRLRDYQWRVTLDAGGEVQIVEQYVVTDDDYSAVPEGRQFREVALNATEQDRLQRMVAAAQSAAATRESVETG